MLENIDWQALQSGISFDFGRIMNFEFTVDNTLFWIILVVIAVLLIEAWGLRRSFFFCATMSIILLGVTRIISWCMLTLNDPQNPFDPAIIKFSAIFFSVLVLFLYGVMRRQ